MSHLVVILGPITSGKSTLADALGEQLRDHGRAVTVLDFDRAIEAVGGWTGLTKEGFATAQFALGREVAVRLAEGCDVIAHGPLFEPGTLDAVLGMLPPASRVSYVRLLVTYETALNRVAADPNRETSRDPDLLRRAHDRIGPLLDALPSPNWTFDTATTPLVDIIEELIVALLRMSTEPSSDD